LDAIIRWSIKRRWLILLIIAGMAGLGIYNYLPVPAD
jgi:Cu/Ag efflux pump CusA